MGTRRGVEGTMARAPMARAPTDQGGIMGMCAENMHKKLSLETVAEMEVEVEVETEVGMGAEVEVEVEVEAEVDATVEADVEQI